MGAENSVLKSTCENQAFLSGGKCAACSCWLSSCVPMSGDGPNLTFPFSSYSVHLLPLWAVFEHVCLVSCCLPNFFVFFLQEFAACFIAVLILYPALLCLGGLSMSVVWGCALVVIFMFWTLVLCWRSRLRGESPKIKTVKQSPIDSKGKIKRRMKKNLYA